MATQDTTINRREFLRLLAATGSLLFLNSSASARPDNVITKPIPSTGENLPVIGMGSWQTFDVFDDDPTYDQEIATRTEILKTFFRSGGRLVDSSPMYGNSEKVIGNCLKRISNDNDLFAATKVWIQGQWLGKRQMEQSRHLWDIKRFDLMQIHNMVDWQDHLETLKEWKANGKIRYIGITTSHGRRHDELEKVLQNESFDFVQFTYNILDREVEKRLLPLTAERDIAVIINRPFQGGGLFNYVSTKPLPKWAKEFDCHNWAQYFLKFIVSHPQVTCAIPATSQVAHMKENMGACYGRLPDAQTRKRMSDYFNA